MTTPKVVLTMIVKNEAKVLPRLLQSVRPYIDAYCIADTGSTDDTIAVIMGEMEGLPGRIVLDPWKDFAFNRTSVLRHASDLGDYCLMLDADEEVIAEPGHSPADFRMSLTSDHHNVMYRNGSFYGRPQITKTSLPYVYRGALHEFLQAPEGTTNGGYVSAFFVRSHPDGARSSNPNKYRDDAELLRQALARNDEPDLRWRYMFYYAQSLKDSGQIEAAEEAYSAAGAGQGWREERYIAWLYAGRLRAELRRPYAHVFEALMLAHEVNPARAEALYQAALFARQLGRFHTAWMFAKAACVREPQNDDLFIEPWVYAWGSKYELSIAAYFAKEYMTGLVASEALLKEPTLPPDERATVQTNVVAYRSLIKG